MVHGLGKPTPSRFPYPDRPQTGPGIGAAGGQVVRARQVIVSGPGSGVFVYSGKPAFGNLIASMDANTTFDGKGNPVLPGIVAYTVVGGTTFAQEMQGAGTTVGIYPPGGPWTTFVNALQWNVSVGGADLSINIPFTATAGTSAIRTIITTDQWTTVNPPANWTALGAGIRYKLNPDNSVRFQVSAQIGAAAAPGTITLATLAAPYVPQNQFRGCAPGVFVNGAIANTTFDTRFQVTIAGQYQFLGFPGGAGGAGLTEIDGQWDVPLD